MSHAPIRRGPSGDFLEGENANDVPLWDPVERDWVAGPIPGGGGVPALSHEFWVDGGTAVDPLEQDGSIGKPFSTIAAALLAAAAVPEVNFAKNCSLQIVPGDYSGEGLQTLPLDYSTVTLFYATGPGVKLPAFATQDPVGAISALAFYNCEMAGFTAAQGGAESQWQLDLLGGCLVTGAITMFGSLGIHSFGGGRVSQTQRNHINANVSCGVCTASEMSLGTGCTAFTMGGESAWFNTTLSNDARVISIPGGSLSVDTYTLNNLFANNATFSAAEVFNVDQPISTTVAVNVPGLLEGELAYVDVDVTGTRLEGRVGAGTLIGWAPAEDIEAAGAGNGGAFAARASAANTIRVSFFGVTTAHAANFSFWIA